MRRSFAQPFNILVSCFTKRSGGIVSADFRFFIGINITKKSAELEIKPGEFSRIFLLGVFGNSLPDNLL